MCPAPNVDKAKVEKHLKRLETANSVDGIEIFFFQLSFAPKEEQHAVLDELERSVVTQLRHSLPKGEDLARLRKEVDGLGKSDGRELNTSSMLFYRLVRNLDHDKGDKLDGLLRSYLDETAKIPEEEIFTNKGQLKLLAALAAKEDAAPANTNTNTKPKGPHTPCM